MSEFNMTIKPVAALSGPVLDWAVAEVEGITCHTSAGCVLTDRIICDNDGLEWEEEYSPSTDWSQGGPIIEREVIWLTTTGTFGPPWKAEMQNATAYGPTPLIAAMRAYVLEKWGDELYVPNELL
ncbi:MAG: DUF2591 domain-containing protein, partial [Gammaproteobacteria bacterium SHHR-1]